jgi:RNA polymerase sigma-70 factor (ECF subfamily)
MTNTPPTPATLAKDLESWWLRFIDTFEPWRPALYRFCRSLTRTPWDAEDLMQDALMRAFSTPSAKRSTRAISSA